MESKSKQCKVVMLTTDEKAIIGQVCTNNIQMFKWTKAHVAQDVINIMAEYKETKFQHLYITSNEEIKKDDFVYSVSHAHPNGVIKRCFDIYNDELLDLENEVTPKGLCKKIIATTDPGFNLPKLKESFINKHINEYNKGNVITDVMVEYSKSDRERGEFNEILRPHLSVKGEITIKRVKDSWTEEELHLHMQYYMEYCESNGYITPKNWIERKKRF